MDAYAAFADDYHWFLDDTRLRVGCDTPGVRLALRAIPPGGRVLDSACGIGVDAIWLDRRGFRVTAVDASAPMVRQAQQRIAAAGARQVSLRAVDWLGLEDTLPSCSFDAVLCIGSSIAHADDLAAVLQVFHGLLADDGLLIVDTRDWETTASPDAVTEVEPVIVERHGRRCRRTYEWRQPAVPGPVELRATLEFLAADDSVETSQTWTVRQHAFSRRQLRSALELAGFHSITMDRIPGDDRYTVTARR